jgi:hypothetical protein
MGYQCQASNPSRKAEVGTLVEEIALSDDFHNIPSAPQRGDDGKAIREPHIQGQRRIQSR